MGVEVKIMGKTFQVKSQYEESFTTETADLVNAKMKELIGKSNQFSMETVAILAAMNIAGDLLKLSRSENKRKADLRKTLESINIVLQEKQQQFDQQRSALENK
jgi:cell division protein ZapA (FtsZ GTPase activity inhibitor)